MVNFCSRVQKSTLAKVFSPPLMKGEGWGKYSVVILEVESKWYLFFLLPWASANYLPYHLLKLERIFF